jgi:hypothetical protein
MVLFATTNIGVPDNTEIRVGIVGAAVPAV